MHLFSDPVKGFNLFKSSKLKAVNEGPDQHEDDILQGKKEYHRQLEVPLSPYTYIHCHFNCIHICHILLCTGFFNFILLEKQVKRDTKPFLFSHSHFCFLILIFGFRGMQFSERRIIFMFLGVISHHLFIILLSWDQGTHWSFFQLCMWPGFFLATYVHIVLLFWLWWSLTFNITLFVFFGHISERTPGYRLLQPFHVLAFHWWQESV